MVNKISNNGLHSLKVYPMPLRNNILQFSIDPYAWVICIYLVQELSERHICPLMKPSERICFYNAGQCDLDLWHSDLKKKEVHLLVMTKLPTKFWWNLAKSFTLKGSETSFTLKVTVILISDLKNQKSIGVIYLSCPNFLSSLVNLDQRVH